VWLGGIRSFLPSGTPLVRVLGKYNRETGIGVGEKRDSLSAIPSSDSLVRVDPQERSRGKGKEFVQGGLVCIAGATLENDMS